MNNEDKLFELLELLLSHLEHFNDEELEGLKKEVQRVLLLKLAKNV